MRPLTRRQAIGASLFLPPLLLAEWRRAADLAHARRHADDALRRGTTAGESGWWTQAENRVSPDQVAAQTGWMQGAAGMGAMLLRLDAATRGEAPWRAAAFPDLRVA